MCYEFGTPCRYLNEPGQGLRKAEGQDHLHRATAVSTNRQSSYSAILYPKWLVLSLKKLHFRAQFAVL